MKNIPGGHNLFVQDKEVATLIENVYSVIYFYNEAGFSLPSPSLKFNRYSYFAKR